MTKEDLAQFDGQEGRKAYVAVNRAIYDVTASSYWKDGDHQKLHQAGRDLTAELMTAPHVRSVIERFPVVGELEDQREAPSPAKGGSKTGLIMVAVVVIAALVWLFSR